MTCWFLENVPKRHFFPILGTLQMGAAREDALPASDPDAVQNPYSQQSERFLPFFGARLEGRRYGRAPTIDLSRSGTLVGQATRGEPAKPKLLTIFGCAQEATTS